MQKQPNKRPPTQANSLTKNASVICFLTSIANLDTDTILNLHHQITMYAVDISQQIENFLVHAKREKHVPVSDVIEFLDSIMLLNSKVMGTARFATKANFRLDSEKIRADLSAYIEQYANGVARDFLLKKIGLVVENDAKPFVQSFKPIDVSVVVDNLISNAKKAKASKITVKITQPNKDALHIRVSDNGKGFDRKIVDHSRIFEKGFTTTDGSGLGLYHVQQVLGEMNGTIEVVEQNGAGVTFLIRISK